MNELALFAGAGGGILGGALNGWRTRCAVEIDSYARNVLLARQRDGMLPKFPIWDDIRTFDGKQWAGSIDVVTGGFPCQDISAAGKGAGITGERSGLWKEMARVISEVRPRYAFIENSPMLIHRGLSVVLCDLAEMGFDVRWGTLGAWEIGAKHKRDRIWIVAESNVPNCNNTRHERRVGSTKEIIPNGPTGRSEIYKFGEWWKSEPGVGRMAHGVPNRVDRLKAIGNAQVPEVAAGAWQILCEDFGKDK